MQAQEGKADQAAAALAHLRNALAGTQAKRGTCGIQAMMAAELLATGDAVAARHLLTPVAGAGHHPILCHVFETNVMCSGGSCLPHAHLSRRCWHQLVCLTLVCFPAGRVLARYSPRSQVLGISRFQAV